MTRKTLYSRTTHCLLAFGFSVLSGNTWAQEEISLNKLLAEGHLYGLVAPTNLDEGLELKLSPPPPVFSVELDQPAADVWTEIRRSFAIPELVNNEVAQRELALTRRPEAVHAMLARSRPFIYFIAQECVQRGLPTELALIPFVESQFNPHARSPASAEGLWQFIPSTGRQYDLKQNRYVDERRDLRASTRAALDYLSYLYDLHGDWHLALISYNWGEGSVLKAMKKAKNAGRAPVLKNLDLPQETRQYIPKLQALKNIINSPERFNVALPNVPNVPYFTEISHNGDLDLREIARIADIDLESIKKLNTGLNHTVMYASQGNTLLVPLHQEDKVKETLENYQGLQLPPPPSKTARLSAQSNTRKYKVRSGDTLIDIAKTVQTTVDHLLRLNNINRRTPLKPGAIIRVPANPQGKPL